MYKMLREMGYLVIIEPAFDGRNADLLIHDINTLETVIIEIEFHKNYHHAIKSIESDLRFGNVVIVFCDSETIKDALYRLSAKLEKPDRQRVHFVLTNQYIYFIRTLFQNKDNNNIHNRTRNNIRTQERRNHG